MKLAIIGYNNSIHSATGLTPLELTLGHTKAHDPFDLCYDQDFYNNYLTKHVNRLKLLYENLGEKMQEEKEKNTEKRNTKLQTKTLQAGQEVYLKQTVGNRSKTTPKFTGPYEVKKVLKNNTATMVDKNNKEKKVHIKNLKYGSVPDASSSEPPEQPGPSN